MDRRTTIAGALRRCETPVQSPGLGLGPTGMRLRSQCSFSFHRGIRSHWRHKAAASGTSLLESDETLGIMVDSIGSGEFDKFVIDANQHQRCRPLADEMTVILLILHL